MIEVGFASTPEQLDQVRGLMRSFVAWHRQRHIDDLKLIDDTQPYYELTEQMEAWLVFMELQL